MALPSSGSISLNQVNIELSRSGTAQISMNDSIVRTLFGVASGQISMSNGYGKSNAYAPVNTSAPTISGTAWIDYTLSVSSNGSWNAQPAITSYSYQWQRNGSNITGATGSSYTLTTSDFGYTIRCVVTATNSVGSTAAASASSAAVTYATGQSVYTSPGSYTWYTPTGVSSISIVAVGGGSGGGSTAGGRGGGLGYRNNYPVTQAYGIPLVVGAGGTAAPFSGASSGVGEKSWMFSQYYFNDGSVYGGGGDGTGPGYAHPTGGIGGERGYSGYGGGGAAGYSGYGGTGGDFGVNGTAAQGGGGGGGATYVSGTWATGGGGGVGIYGQGSSGAGGTSGYRGGGGGSGGSAGGDTGAAGGFGAGGGGSDSGSGFFPGGGGAVRIVWPGSSRQFPSTNVGNF